MTVRRGRRQLSARIQLPHRMLAHAPEPTPALVSQRPPPERQPRLECCGPGADRRPADLLLYLPRTMARSTQGANPGGVPAPEPGLPTTGTEPAPHPAADRALRGFRANPPAPASADGAAPVPDPALQRGIRQRGIRRQRTD